MKQKYFFFDAESNGLYGQAFVIGAIVYNENGDEIDRIALRCPIDEEINSWVAENVIPKISNIPLTNDSYDSMLQDFFNFWKKHKGNTAAVVHMGQIVESKLLLDGHAAGCFGDMEGPYEWIDVCSYNEIKDSVDNYIQQNNIDLPLNSEGLHNPLYDCEVTAKAYFHWQQKRQQEKEELSQLKTKFLQ